MFAYAGPLVLVLLGLCGLVFIFGRRVGRQRSALQELPQPVGDYAEHRVPQRSKVTSLGTRTRSAERKVLGLVRVFRVVGRALATFLRRPPVSFRVPRLSWRSTARSVLGTPPKAGPMLRREGFVTALPVAAPLAEAPPSESAREDVGQVAAPEPAMPSDVAVTDEEGEQSTPEPVPAVAVFTDVAEQSEPVLEETTGEEAPRSPALETHVEEQRPGRRKVVGRVRTAREGTRRPRKVEKAVGPPPPEPVGIERAAALVEAGDLVLAEELLVAHLSERPRDVEGYRLLALLYLRRGDAAQAREVCEEALRRDPGATTLYGPLGHAYARLGRYGQALQVFQRAHDADESNLQYLEALLAIAARMDRRPLVRVTAEKILMLQPDHQEAKKHLAKVAAGA